MIKIGWSQHPKKRLKELQTACADKLRLVGVMEGDADTERRLHWFFRNVRVRGEWFEADAVLLWLVANEHRLLRQDAPPPPPRKRRRSKQTKAPSQAC